MKITIFDTDNGATFELEVDKIPNSEDSIPTPYGKYTVIGAEFNSITGVMIVHAFPD